MFGSKIRSWMENHIALRPKKSRNKNKTGNSNNGPPANTQNGHKGTPHQNEASHGSPARRSEVSPIQSHTASRVGWQSPKDNNTPMSPKSDHFPYVHMVKSKTSPKIVQRKSSYNYIDVHPSQHPHHHQPQTTLHLPPPPTVSSSSSRDTSQTGTPKKFFASKTMDTNLNHYDNSNCITTSKGGSYPNGKKASNDPGHYRDDEGVGGGGKANNTTDGLIYENSHAKEAFDKSKQKPKLIITTTPTLTRNTSQYTSTTSIATNNRNPLDAYDMNEIRFINGRNARLMPTESKYGKILQTNRAPINNHDKINANCPPIFSSTVADGGLGARTENNNNNHNHNHNNNILNNNSFHYPPPPAVAAHHAIFPPGHHHQALMVPENGSNTTALIKGPRGEFIKGGAALRPVNRYSNCSTLSAPGSHHHVMNSLSSPESAYSTGYSTDGTSPGASYTPEYYINIRTGTHYFPKSIGSGGISNGDVMVANRLKFGLNKIDEARQESSSSLNCANDLVYYHRRTESFDLGKNYIHQNAAVVNNIEKAIVVPTSGRSPILQKNLGYQSIKAIESPSPRQRCRIRTNPWFSNTDTSSSSLSGLNRKNDIDSGSTSSGIRSSSDAGTELKKSKNGQKKIVLSESDSSTTSTEKDFSIKTFSPNTIRRRKTTEIFKIETKTIHVSATTVPGQASSALAPLSSHDHSVCASSSKQHEHSSQQESDEDATLNEVMGKFDESYVYEKETDILSDDSDQTDCQSDLDTGQDAEDEYDTDELLDIDFIDTGSIQEIIEKDIYKNTGSCSYHHTNSSSNGMEKRPSKLRKSRKQDLDGSRRRKKLIRRKKSSESQNSNGLINRSPSPMIRGCRSVGGTPVSLRRNQSEDRKRQTDMSPLSNRSNSLILTEVHSVKSRVLAIAESEKALLKADLEADVKYKQLIHEAETILFSLKSNVSRDTPVASPRRVCNVPTNKRVEMLRNCEVELKRELAKTSLNAKQQQQQHTDCDKSENVLHNKRLDLLKFETASAPNSPKSCRFSPRKTHVTNFINQNASPTEILRRKNSPDAVVLPTPVVLPSPRIQLNGSTMLTPPRSPTPSRRRFRSHSPKSLEIDSSDSDNERNETKPLKKSVLTRTMNINFGDEDSNHNKSQPEEVELKRAPTPEDLINHNTEQDGDVANQVAERKKPPLMTFRSVDIGHQSPESSYCPQSEPLKRKIYTCSATYDKIQKSLDVDSEIPKKALLDKIAHMRNQRRVAQKTIPESSYPDESCDKSEERSDTKRQLILDTIEDLKRSLEDQSVELYGLNDPND